MGWDGIGWDGMGWDGMGWDGMGTDRMIKTIMIIAGRARMYLSVRIVFSIARLVGRGGEGRGEEMRGWNC